MTTQSFQMFAGDDKTLRFTVKDGNGAAVSIASATIKWQATRSLGKSSVISKTTTSGISITDAAAGQFEVTIDPTDTDSLTGTYQYEAEVTFSGGNKSTVAQGQMQVRPVVVT